MEASALPCPFCSSPAKYRGGPDRPNAGTAFDDVGCDDPTAMCALTHLPWVHITDWNQRPATTKEVADERAIAVLAEREWEATRKPTEPRWGKLGTELRTLWHDDVRRFVGRWAAIRARA